MAKRRPKPKAKAVRKAADLDVRRDWPDPWDKLIAAFGSTQALADELGTTTMTIGRWADGESDPLPATKKWVNLVAAQKGIKPPFV